MPRLALVWRLPEFPAGRSSSPSRCNRVTIRFSMPLRFDSRNDGRWAGGRWYVLAAQRSILPVPAQCPKVTTLRFLVGYCAELRLVLAAWILGPRAQQRPLRPWPSHESHPVKGPEEGRNGELKCMCRSPGMRCSLQGAIEQKNNWVAGAQSQNGKLSALSEDAARHSTQSQRPGSARREPQSVKPAGTTRHCYSLVSRLARLLPLFWSDCLQTKRRLWAVDR